MSNESQEKQIKVALSYAENAQQAYLAHNGKEAESQYRKSLDLLRKLEQPNLVTITLANRGQDRLSNHISDGFTDWGMALCLAIQVSPDNFTATWSYIWRNMQAHLEKKQYRLLLEGAYRCTERMKKTVETNKFTQAQLETLWILNGIVRIVGSISEYKLTGDAKRKADLNAFIRKAASDIDTKTGASFQLTEFITAYLPEQTVA